MRKIKRRKRIKTIKKANDEHTLVVICPKCKTIIKLHDLAAWSFIILEDVKCKKCETTMTHKDVID